jgi:hypothetical protein
MNTPSLDGVKQSLNLQIAQNEGILAQLPALTATGVLDTETADLRAYKLRAEISQLRSPTRRTTPCQIYKRSPKPFPFPNFGMIYRNLNADSTFENLFGTLKSCVKTRSGG